MTCRFLISASPKCLNIFPSPFSLLGFAFLIIPVCRHCIYISSFLSENLSACIESWHLSAMRTARCRTKRAIFQAKSTQMRPHPTLLLTLAQLLLSFRKGSASPFCKETLIYRKIGHLWITLSYASFLDRDEPVNDAASAKLQNMATENRKTIT